MHPYKTLRAAAGPLCRAFTPRWEGLLIPLKTSAEASHSPTFVGRRFFFFPDPTLLGVGCGFHSAPRLPLRHLSAEPRRQHQIASPCSDLAPSLMAQAAESEVSFTVAITASPCGPHRYHERDLFLFLVFPPALGDTRYKTCVGHNDAEGGCGEGGYSKDGESDDDCA